MDFEHQIIYCPLLVALDETAIQQAIRVGKLHRKHGNEWTESDGSFSRYGEGLLNSDKPLHPLFVVDGENCSTEIVGKLGEYAFSPLIGQPVNEAVLASGDDTDFIEPIKTDVKVSWRKYRDLVYVMATNHEGTKPCRLRAEAYIFGSVKSFSPERCVIEFSGWALQDEVKNGNPMRGIRREATWSNYYLKTKWLHPMVDYFRSYCPHRLPELTEVILSGAELVDVG